MIYDNDEQFPIGGLKVVRKSDKDTATVIGAGVTLFEALKAHDELKAKGISIRVIDLYSVQPIDAASLIEAGQRDRPPDHGRGSLYFRRAWRRRGARRGARGPHGERGSRCRRFRAAASPMSCSTSSASPPVTSSTQ